MLLYVSDAGMILSLGVFGAYFYMKVLFRHYFSTEFVSFPWIVSFFMSFQDVARADPPGWVPLVALMVYVVCFSVGFGPIPWLMMGEVFPARQENCAH